MILGHIEPFGVTIPKQYKKYPRSECGDDFQAQVLDMMTRAGQNTWARFPSGSFITPLVLTTATKGTKGPKETNRHQMSPNVLCVVAACGVLPRAVISSFKSPSSSTSRA